MSAVSSSMGVMAALLTKLATLLSGKYKQLKRVREKIEFLSRELTEMNAVLEKLADMEKLDGQQKLWRNNVREMAYDIEDCIDVFMYHLGDGDNKDGLLKKTARKLRNLRARYQMNNKIQELKARVMQVAERRDRYINLGESTSSLHKVMEIDLRLPALYEDAKKLVGVDGPCKEITQLLLDEEANSSLQQLKVLSIVGFGGIGKTTLAKQVYNQLKNQFDCTSFVSVSQNPDMVKVLRHLLSGLGFHGYGILDDHQKLIDTLRGHLSNKRYLIVIDDIWSTKIWSIIRCAFVQNNYGSRVITTTRIEDVAMNCCFGFDGPYNIQPLDEVDSRRLFCTRIFGPDDIPEQYGKIIGDILKKCKGVPLAIISIASLLASQSMHLDNWEKIENYLVYELETNPTLEWMRHVLNLSYNDLSPDLRTCFLYLGIYPEDYKIFKADLIRLWIAEGFIREKPGLDMEDAGESYFNELINRSLVQPDDRVLDNCPGFPSGDEVISCRVHDLMLDLIISKCQEENFLTVASTQTIMNVSEFPVRRLCHQFTYKNLAIERMKLSQVRSLISFPLFDCTMLPPISKFEHLRVMELMTYVESMFLDLSSVSNLILLRHLRIRGFKLKLPEKIGRLQCLRTLDLLGSLLVTGIPSDVISLSSLCHLTVSSDLELPNGIGRLVSLQTLLAFDIDRSYILDLSKDSDHMMFFEALKSIDEAERYFLDTMPCNMPAASLLNFHLPTIGGYSGVPELWGSLQRLVARKSFHSIPIVMIIASRLAVLELCVKVISMLGVFFLGTLTCLVELDLTAEATIDKNIIIDPTYFPSLQKFIFTCDLSYTSLTIEAGAMPQLQILKLDDRNPSHLEKGRVAGGAAQNCSPLVGIEHLPRLEDVEVTSNSSKETGYRDAVRRHPRFQDIRATFNIYTEV